MAGVKHGNESTRSYVRIFLRGSLFVRVVHLFVYLVYCLLAFVWLSFPTQGVKGISGGMASPTGVAGRWFSSLGWAWLATLPCRVSRARARRTWSMPGNPVFGFWAVNFHLLHNMSSNCRLLVGLLVWHSIIFPPPGNTWPPEVIRHWTITIAAVLLLFGRLTTCLKTLFHPC